MASAITSCSKCPKPHLCEYTGKCLGLTAPSEGRTPSDLVKRIRAYHYGLADEVEKLERELAQPSDEYRVLHAAYEAQKVRLAGAEARIAELEQGAPSARGTGGVLPEVAAGMVLVPTEPTEEMAEAALHIILATDGEKPTYRVRRIYRAMLSARPALEPQPRVQK